MMEALRLGIVSKGINESRIYAKTKIYYNIVRTEVKQPPFFIVRE